MRLGLCCLFHDQPIQFRQTTAKALKRLGRRSQLVRLSQLCLANVQSLKTALQWLESKHIGAFRVLSPLFPRYTHPEVAYHIEELPDAEILFNELVAIKNFRKKHDIRLSLHPDQFNVLSSPHEHVIANTLRELEYQGYLAELIGAEVINIHAGGGYGNKNKALDRFKNSFGQLSDRVKSRLAIENDDTTYSPKDLLPLCRSISRPLVYDVHHHRCLPDSLSVEDATEQCIQSWEYVGHEPYFHISSPKDGWMVKNLKPHADYINPMDFPHHWLNINGTIDIEAKAKELAVLRLQTDLRKISTAAEKF